MLITYQASNNDDNSVLHYILQTKLLHILDFDSMGRRFEYGQEPADQGMRRLFATSHFMCIEPTPFLFGYESVPSTGYAGSTVGVEHPVVPAL